ncbi:MULTISPECIES: hypothetical protein [Sphingobacterium]|uniref:hypothetical protein n=1 Tax=Sphingobacterium TaxID=28453 RepID=UPI00257D1547|nr:MULTISPECIES: hypothetical protein [Sphingobacterium]
MSAQVFTGTPGVYVLRTAALLVWEQVISSRVKVNAKWRTLPKFARQTDQRLPKLAHPCPKDRFLGFSPTTFES